MPLHAPTYHYAVAPIFCRPWTLNGLSARLIESHYEYNYGNAVARLNALTSEIAILDVATAPPGALARLKRDQGAILNSTLLHELYFASLGGDGRALPDRIVEALDRDFGSVERWRREFVALAESLGGGSGWALLSYVPRDHRLINHTGTDHTHSIAGAIPILALDMYEHAYHMEFGPNGPAYVAAFMRNIDWNAAQGRYDDAVKVAAPRALEQKEFGGLPSISVEDVKTMLASGAPVQIVDTRPRHYASRTQEIMDGAVWRDPENVDDWIDELSKEAPVVTFCVYGFHVGCEVAAKLRKAGFNARYMAGGHSTWKAAKGPTRLFDVRAPMAARRAASEDDPGSEDPHQP